MIVISTLLISLVTVALSSTQCTPVGSQCSTTVTPSLTCDAATTCCGCPVGCPYPCTDVSCTSLAAGAGSTFTIFGDDNAMDIIVSGEKCAYGSTITGEAMQTFTCSGVQGFKHGAFEADPANDNVGLAVLCSAEECCNEAEWNITYAASFSASAVDAAYNTQFHTTWPLNGVFFIDCYAGGACESADFTIEIPDCLGADTWVVPSINCAGTDACHSASFTFIMGDPFCTLVIGDFICQGAQACADVRVYTSGQVNMTADCECITGADVCTGAGSDPAGFCTSFADTFSPTAAPVPTTSPTPCPSTAEPTTAAPTTAAPTTAAPTTAAPTTAAPTTAAPTTAAPTTAAPTVTANTESGSDSDSDSDGDSDEENLAELLNAARANQDEQEEEESGLFGDGTDTDNDNVTNYEMVISLSNEALEHLWAIVITFVVFNGVCIWCYYHRFGGKNKRYGDSLPSTV